MKKKRIEIVEGGFYIQKKRPENVRYVRRLDQGIAHWLGFDAKSGEYYNVNFPCSVDTFARLSERRLTDEEASKMKLEEGLRAFMDLSLIHI